MPDIYVDIGSMDSSKVPKDYAAKAKATMQKSVERAVKAASGFTADKKGEGYSIRLKVADCKVDAKGASCKITGELVRFPQPEMVSTSISGNAKADGGKPESLVADCIEASVEAIMKRILPVMVQQART